MTSDTDFFVHPDWVEAFEQSRLLDFDAYEQGLDAPCLSRHTRGAVYSVTLPDGRHVFAKFDALSKTKRILFDLLLLRWPQPLTYRERTALKYLAAANLRGPEVLAWRQRRRSFLIPHQAVMILSKLEGVSLIVFMKSHNDPAIRQTTLKAVGQEVGKIYRARLQWPDLGVDHVFVTPDLQVGFLDVDRLAPKTLGLRRLAAKQLRVLVRELVSLGASGPELAAFLEGLAQTTPPELAACVARLKNECK